MNVRSHDETAESRQTETDADEAMSCPECGGDLVASGAETVCEECGLVVEEEEIDHGPEWRAFDAEEKDEKSRVGAPTTNLMHDKGLSTNIGWQDEDAYGNSLSASQREKMQRLRTWNERFRTSDSKERNLKQALGEIERMASALGLPENVRETASVIYRRALDENLLPGRSIEGMASASLYAAARMGDVPRSLDEVANVARVERERVKRAYRYVVQELNLEVEPADPEQYVPRFASEVGVDSEVERRARELVEDARDTHVLTGKSPVGIAAAALYAAGLLAGESITQREVSEAADVSEVTIRNRYKDLLEAAEDVPSVEPDAREAAGA